MRGLIVALAAVLTVGCTADAHRLGGVEQDPSRAGERPNMPIRFGQWGLFERHDRSSAYFTTEDLSQGVHVSVYAPGEFERRVERLEDAARIDNWWCGTDANAPVTAECFTLAWEEEINLSSQHLGAHELAGFGDEMLQAWTGATS